MKKVICLARCVVVIQNIFSSVKRYQATLSRNKLKIEELSGEGSQVDRYATASSRCSLILKLHRYLIKNIIMTYFIASDKKKPDIIQLLAKILHFTDQELDQVKTELSLVGVIMCVHSRSWGLREGGWPASGDDQTQLLLPLRLGMVLSAHHSLSCLLSLHWRPCLSSF